MCLIDIITNNKVIVIAPSHLVAIFSKIIKGINIYLSKLDPFIKSLLEIFIKNTINTKEKKVVSIPEKTQYKIHGLKK
jgi:hypothetical protein